MSDAAVRIHVDTDFAGDPDDACALALVLGWPGVELLGVTTNLDADGGRAACVEHVLALAGRADVPVAAGAATSSTTGQAFESTWRDEAAWPVAPLVRRTPPGAALDLLARSIASGATVLAIGALTNLATLELLRPGTLTGVRVVAMAGWFERPGAGWPAWDAAMDFNVQSDVRAAQIVLDTADVTLVPGPLAMRAQLRARDLDRLRATGPVGELLARQSLLHAERSGIGEIAAAHDRLADDLVNFHWDPVAAAVAVGWDGVEVAERPVAVEADGDLLRFVPGPGPLRRVATDLDADAFTEVWLASVEAVDARAGAADAVTIEWRARFTNREVNVLHAEAFETRVFDDAEWDWRAQVDGHSLGWVIARERGALIGFVNVLWDGLVHAWIQDVMVAASGRGHGIGTRLVTVAVEQARRAGCDWLHVDFEDDLRPFYFDACGFTPTNAGLIALR